MRIAFVTSEYPTEKASAGGLSAYLGRMSRHLAERGHNVEVFTLSDANESLVHEGILVHRVHPRYDIAGRAARVKYLWRYTGYARSVVASGRLAWRLWNRHRAERFDVVQAANYLSCGLVCAFRKVAPLVTRVSSYGPMWRTGYETNGTPEQLQIERCEIVQMRRSNVVYAPSRLIADMLAEREGIPCRVVETPIDPAEMESLAAGPVPLEIPRPYALFFGAIGRLKGCDQLVRVLPALLDRNPDFSFVFVGRVQWAANGERYDEYIRQQLGRYGNRVLALSELRPAELAPIIRGARFVALPSQIDNMPNTCLEAMALNRVVIATRGASFEQLVTHGTNGFLVSQTSDEELAACMQQVWEMPDQSRAEIGLRARDSLARLHPKQVVDQLLNVYQDAIAGARRSSRR